MNVRKCRQHPQLSSLRSLVEKKEREMGRGQLKGIWSEERTVFSTEDTNDPFDRERLSYPFSPAMSERKGY